MGMRSAATRVVGGAAAASHHAPSRRRRPHRAGGPARRSSVHRASLDPGGQPGTGILRQCGGQGLVQALPARAWRAATSRASRSRWVCGAAGAAAGHSSILDGMSQPPVRRPARPAAAAPVRPDADCRLRSATGNATSSAWPSSRPTTLYERGQKALRAADYGEAVRDLRGADRALSVHAAVAPGAARHHLRLLQARREGIGQGRRRDLHPRKSRRIRASTTPGT